MPPRKDGDYMEVDSNSDAFLSDDDLYEDTTNKKGKGKSSSKKGKDKGKSKVAEVSPFCCLVLRTCRSLRMRFPHVTVANITATIRLGGVVYTFMGDCSGGRRWKFANNCGRYSCSWAAAPVSISFSYTHHIHKRSNLNHPGLSVQPWPHNRDSTYNNPTPHSHP